MNKPILLAVLLAGLTICNEADAQLTGIAINDNGAKADTSAILDVNLNVTAPKRGFLLPHMTTTQRDAIYQPAKGLLIYATNVDSLEINLGTPASPLWSALAINAWTITGNSGTNSTNFLGTKDNVSLRFRTNNAEQVIIDSLGHVGIGSNIFDATNPAKLLVDYGNTTSNTLANFRGSINNYLQINIQNGNSGSNASSDIVATADIGTDTTNYIDMGINGSNYASGPDYWGGALDAYLYSYSKNLLIGTQKASTDIIFLYGGGSVKNNAALRIAAPGGNIIVGKGENTNAPVGNILRGPNASSGSTNIAGGDLTIQGGSASGTATGGSINIFGGGTVSGTNGAVNINTNSNYSTNINTGSSASNVMIGGSSNNILFPKFTTIGNLIYTAANTGQIGATSQLTWYNTNSRLGIGTSSPQHTLDINANTNPLHLAGVQTGTNTDSILTIVNGVVRKLDPASLTTSSSNAWALVGNSNATSGNFVGTTNNIPLNFKTSNSQRMIITTTGNFGIGDGLITSSFNGTHPEKVLIDAGLTNSFNLIQAQGTINNYLQFNIQNLSQGGFASSDVVATADNGTEDVNYIDMGINSSNYNNNTGILGYPNTAYLYSTGNDFTIGNTTASKSLIFLQVV